jgi:hypothetical protein
VDATSKLKALEVLGLLLAGGAFVWWQFRDLKREQDKSRKRREQEAMQGPASASSANQKSQDPRP